jgi:hypothetical protein
LKISRYYASNKPEAPPSRKRPSPSQPSKPRSVHFFHVASGIHDHRQSASL